MRARWLVPLVLLALPGAIGAAEPGAVPELHITYVTGSSVYLDAGEAEGLRQGDRVEVLRDGAVIAVLEVTYLSSHRSSCTVKESTQAPREGDRARLVTTGRPAVPPPVPVPEDHAPAEKKPRRLHGAGLHGRVGLRYLRMDDGSERDADFQQPALDLRLDGRSLGGAPVDLFVDVRARRTSRNTADDDQARVYRMSLSWNPVHSGFDVTAGRQFAAQLAAVSIFDGLLGRYSGERWTVGAFSGWQPDRDDLGYSNDIQEHGAFFQVRSRRSAATRWNITTGIIGSYADGEVNREYLYIQGRLSHRLVSAYLAQEIDYNRDWKGDVEESTFEGTSTFASLIYRAARWIQLRAGYDDRRNVRLYRDRETPETEFDDAFRQGTWVGASFRWAGRWRGTMDYRTRSGGTAGDADSYMATLSVGDMTSWDLGVGARTTRYQTDTVEGWLHSLTFDFSPSARTHVAIFGGVRTEQDPNGGNLDESIPWYGVDVDVSLGRRWYLLLSAERSAGDLEDYTQYYTSVSYRF